MYEEHQPEPKHLEPQDTHVRKRTGEVQETFSKRAFRKSYTGK